MTLPGDAAVTMCQMARNGQKVVPCQVVFLCLKLTKKEVVFQCEVNVGCGGLRHETRQCS